MTGIDQRAFVVGAAVTLSVMVPPIVAVRVLLGSFSDQSNGWLAVLGLFSVACVVGGITAGRLARHRHLQHGAAATSGAFVFAVVAGLVRRSVTGDDVITAAIAATVLFFALLAASLGVVGALVGSRPPRRRHPIGPAAEESS